MYSQSFAFSGYVPALANEQVGKKQDQMAVVDGENFAWTTDGVFSAYGHDDAGAPEFAVAMAHPHTAIIDGQLHVFYGNGVYRWDGAAWTLTFAFAGAPTFTNPKGWDLFQYKWTEAYIGTTYWFCHPAIGLLYYDAFTGDWGWFRDDCWTGPVYACAGADNRLVLLLEDTVVWSKFDRGDQFSCDIWQAGAGAQSLALIKYGQPYTIMPYNGGWLTFTSEGVMVSRPVQDPVGAPDMRSLAYGALVFNHKLVTNEEVCYGPCAACHMDETAVFWLTQKGFRIFAPSQGGGWGAAQEWQPEVGRFYADYLLPLSDTAAQDRYCLDVARNSGWLFVSSRPNDDIFGYTRAHVFQADLGKWGSFNLAHAAIGYGAASRRVSDMSFITISGGLKLVRHKNGTNRRSWIKFSPMRLQMPNDPGLSAAAVTTVQKARVGVGAPSWALSSPMALSSTWADAKKKPDMDLPGTLARFFMSGGFDDTETNGDQVIWMTPVSAHGSIVYLAGSTTGVTHTFGALADGNEEFFHITSLELDFTFTGVK